MAEQYSIVWVCLSVYVYVHMCMCGFTYTHTHTHTHFICSSVDGYLGCFYILAIVSSATVRIGLHVSFQVRAFIFSRYMPRSRIVSCAYWPSVCLPWRNVHLGLLLMFWLGCCFFVIDSYVLLVYFERLALVSPIICKYFLPIHGLSFNFVYGFLYCARF